MSHIIQIAQDFLHLIIPYKCTYCGMNLHKYEDFICKVCLNKIPKTNYYKNSINTVNEIFWGRVKLEYAYSHYLFTKGSILQTLIHKIKYNDEKELAVSLGKEIAYDIENTDIPKMIDIITSVPLHPRKERFRGYNQSDLIAKGIAEILNIPFRNDILRRTVHTSTQTKKSREQRWDNVKDAFELIDKNSIKNKSIAVVDDVLTTGATLEACVSKLLMCENVKVGIISLALASD